MLKLVPAGENDIVSLAALADEIWHEYFPGIISEEQVDYMVDRFQSEHAMREQISSRGYRYYFIVNDNEHIGYAGLVPEHNVLFISKVYLRKKYRGRGLGTAAIQEIFRICETEGFVSAYLTVNKGNARAIKAYERNGFKKVREQAADIGCGFVMDDYVMEKVF